MFLIEYSGIPIYCDGYFFTSEKFTIFEMSDKISVYYRKKQWSKIFEDHTFATI